MLNSCVLIGQIEKIEKLSRNRNLIWIQVDKPFRENDEDQYDYEHIPVMFWVGMANILIEHEQIGRYVVIRGRIATQKDNPQVYVAGEKISLLSERIYQESLLKLSD